MQPTLRRFVLLCVLVALQTGGCDWEEWRDEALGNEEQDAPSTFSLLSPADGATGIPVLASLSWSPAAEVAWYRVQVSTTSDFSTLEVDESPIYSTSHVLTTALQSVTLHYWRVYAVNDEGQTPADSVRDFTTVPGGALDTSFGGSGKITTVVTAGPDEGSAIAIQTDGRIVVAGNSFDSGVHTFALARYDEDGTLDSAFDGDGKTTTAVGSFDDRALAVAIQSDGKIVAAGYTWNGSDFDLAVVRYTSTGALDTTFDGDGRVITDIAGGSDDYGRALLIQPDGAIVVGGSTGPAGSADFVVVRYTPAGVPDATFDTDGIRVTSLTAGDDLLNGLALQDPGGEIVAVGQADVDFGVVRYTSAGAPDATFDTDGIVITSLTASTDVARGVALQAGGEIVVAGSVDNGADQDFAVVRYTSTGTPDATFDTDGIATTSIGMGDEEAHAVAIQSDGKIVVAGYFFSGTFKEFALVRYTGAGALDGTFDVDGKLIFSIGAEDDVANAVALQTDGRIVAAGRSLDDFAVARLWP